MLNALGEVARCLDEPSQALHFYTESLAVRRKLGDTRGVAMGVTNLGRSRSSRATSSVRGRSLAEGLESLGQCQRGEGRDAHRLTVLVPKPAE